MHPFENATDHSVWVSCPVLKGYEALKEDIQICARYTHLPVSLFLENRPIQKVKQTKESFYT